MILRIIATTGTALIMLTGCGTATEEHSTLSPSLRTSVTEDKSPETLVKLATYLQENPKVAVDSDLRDETVSLLIDNIDGVRKTIADPGGPKTLKAEPEALLRVAIQVAKDKMLAKSVVAAVTTASIDEVADATKTYVASQHGPGDQTRFDSSIADSSRASGALASSLGVSGYETEADAVEVFAYLVDHKEPKNLVAGVPLMTRTIIAANYLNAPAKALTGVVSKRPRYDQPGTIDAIYKWSDSKSSPIRLGDVPGISESAQDQWGKGEGLAAAAGK